MNKLTMLFCASVVLSVGAQGLVPRPEPAFRPKEQLSDESPVAVTTASEVVADNGLYRRVQTTVTFVNPNGRVYEGELEFPLPDGATVCGYALEIDGQFESGVICEKEKARLAFENERRKGVDPGLVEHVKGNVWKTRIYPLMPKVPRKAKITYVEPLAGEPLVVVERDGEDVFVAERGRVAESVPTVADRLRKAKKAWILWDASHSRRGRTAADRNLLECLPEEGEWTLVVFRDVAEPPRNFTCRAELLKAIDDTPCDGGTSFSALARVLPPNRDATFLFSDEMDTLSAKAPDLEAMGVVFASRPDAAPRSVIVRKATPDETLDNVKEGTLLATAWAANRIADLSAQADVRKDEFLALGRKYGVASPVASLIVLESLNQYLEHKIEPPATSRFHDEWVKRRAAEDDPIAARRVKTNHENALLRYWEERVTWWKDPVPKVKKPKSGVFEADEAAALLEAAEDLVADVVLGTPANSAVMAASPTAMRSGLPPCRSPGRSARSSGRPARDETPVSATVKIAAWNPMMPYLKTLSDAPSGSAYAAYLKEREVYGTAPSFYLDCAGWFFKAGDRALACRILSTLADLKLEDVGLWRTMGWRLREAGSYDAAVDVFRHVLAMRGEEPQSGRDLALVLTERGKATGSAADLTEAASLLKTTAFTPPGRKTGRGNRGNDIQTCVLALEELNGLLTWCAANPTRCAGFVAPELDEAYRRDLPLDLRIVLSWDTDDTDVDLHVLEPSGEEAFYGNRRTASGGFVSEDVTTGYGPEEYLKKQAEKGVYKVKTNYFASHRQAISGAAIVTATTYTGWGTAEEKRRILSFRLDNPKDKHLIGEITVK